MLFDTDILIWVLRGSVRAAAFVDEIRVRHISVVTLMELLQGARDRRETQLIKGFIADLGFRTLPLTENIGHRAVVYMEGHAFSSGLRVADALIAATAAENSLTLCSGDRSHYRAISELVLKPFRP
jgi:predicted nucleic acid-binding protein